MNTQTPAPFEGSKPFAQLLMFLGLTGISFFLLGIVLLLMQQTGSVNLLTIQEPANYVDNEVVRGFRIYQLICDVFLFILPVIVIAFLVTRNRLQYLQLNSKVNIRLLILGFVTIIVSTPLITYLSELNARIPLPDKLKDLEQTGDAIETALMAHHTPLDLILNLIVMALAAAISEEFFFRAGLQKLLIKLTRNKHVGVWIAAIIFSAIHMQFSGFFPRMLLGVFLGYLFVWSGSIWVNIFAHFMFNGTQIFITYLQDAKKPLGIVDSIYSTTPGYGYIIASTILVIVLIVFIYKISDKKPEEILPQELG